MWEESSLLHTLLVSTVQGFSFSITSSASQERKLCSKVFPKVFHISSIFLEAKKSNKRDFMEKEREISISTHAATKFFPIFSLLLYRGNIIH